MDQLLKALFPSEADMNPFGSTDINQLLQSFIGPMGAQDGTPYGMYGSMQASSPNIGLQSILAQFAPKLGANPYA